MKKPILVSILLLLGAAGLTYAQENAGEETFAGRDQVNEVPVVPEAIKQQDPAKSGKSNPKQPAKRIKKTAKIQYGMASFYHNKFHGRKTSSGELYDKEKMTAAHNGLPLNTWIRVTNIRNGRTVIVKINDRLHHRNERLVDLSRTAATRLGYIGRGLTRVKVEVLGKMKPAEIAKKDH